MSDQELIKLASVLEVNHLNTGEAILEKSNIKNNIFYIIQSGCIRCTQRKSNKRNVDLMYVLFISYNNYIIYIFSRIIYFIFFS
jgi:CRP-like cAMP-binding protein